MSKPTPLSIAAVVLAVVASTLLPPASAERGGGHWCNPFRDILVNETAGALQSDGTKEFDVVVTNEGRAVVWDVHLDCGYRFRSVLQVDPGLLLQVSHGDCLLVDGGAIVPGGRVSFSYTNYVRYGMAVVNATCTGHRSRV